MMAELTENHILQLKEELNKAIDESISNQNS